MSKDSEFNAWRVTYQSGDQAARVAYDSMLAMQQDFNDAINFALDYAGTSATDFLSLWREGCWEEIQENWPEFKLPSIAK